MESGRIHRGEIWLFGFDPPDKRRPVVVLSRQRVIELLQTVIVAPVTSRIRGLPSEVRLGVDNGLKTESAVNLDHVQTVSKRQLRHFVGSLTPAQMTEVCRALGVATGCG